MSWLNRRIRTLREFLLRRHGRCGNGRLEGLCAPDETGDANYFAYTEPHFDRDRDILIAIEFDDMSKVWINNHLAWNQTVNPWKLGPAHRKVSFKKGFNTVIICMENRCPLMDFSLVLCPPNFLKQD